MKLVATLVCNPAEPVLDALVVRKIAGALGSDKVDWLREGIACDLWPEATDIHSVERTVRDTLSAKPIDIIVQEAASRRKQVLVADMDSTMIGQECIDELAAEVGLKEQVAAITARAMNGEIAFEPALRERVALLKGLTAASVRKVIDSRITLAAGARELVATMRANGGWTALVSGGFTSFTQPIAEELGFDENRANRLDLADGNFAGTVAEPILGRSAKAAAVREIAASRGLSTADVIAVGDGANDLDMIRLAGTGVAMHAKPVVAEQAPVRIDHGDLTALLYLQGYRYADFASHAKAFPDI